VLVLVKASCRSWVLTELGAHCEHPTRHGVDSDERVMTVVLRFGDFAGAPSMMPSNAHSSAVMTMLKIRGGQDAGLLRAGHRLQVQAPGTGPLILGDSLT
jgi:hypothetical protein